MNEKSSTFLFIRYKDKENVRGGIINVMSDAIVSHEIANFP